MNAIRLLGIGDVEPARLEALSRGLRKVFAVDCPVLPGRFEPGPTYHEERQQYHSTEMLAGLVHTGQAGDGLLLGVTAVDLYIPILTFVFGEAQLRGNYSLVSYHRLRQEFYGLPADPAELERRLLKEATHEIGHNLGLVHCDDYSCAMASSNSVEWIDIKEADFCAACRPRVLEKIRSGARPVEKSAPPGVRREER